MDVPKTSAISAGTADTRVPMVGETGIGQDALGNSGMIGTRQNLLIETHSLRQQAIELLAWLEQSERQIQEQLKSEQREDMVRVVAGRSSLEQAITDTRRMIEALDRALEEARRTGETPRSTFAGAVEVVTRLRGMGSVAGMAGARSY